MDGLTRRGFENTDLVMLVEERKKKETEMIAHCII